MRCWRDATILYPGYFLNTWKVLQRDDRRFPRIRWITYRLPAWAHARLKTWMKSVDWTRTVHQRGRFGPFHTLPGAGDVQISRARDW